MGENLGRAWGAQVVEQAEQGLNPALAGGEGLAAGSTGGSVCPL